MRLRIRDVAFAVSDCSTRLPFRFGISTMTWAPTLTARVELESEAGSAVGFSADLLVPKWFEKDPSKSIEEDVRGLMASAQAAAACYRAAPEATAFDLWHGVYASRVLARPFDAPDRLLRGFGVALVERAMLDALCRAAGVSFFAALEQDLPGVRPEVLFPELGADQRGWSLAADLPDAPADSVALRHTVGLVDELRSDEVAVRIDDGRPEALEEDIEAYGLSWFKLKLCGDAAIDLPRCLDFAEVVRAKATPDWRVTVDGNEQFASAAGLADFVEELARRDADLVARLELIEQPLARTRSFEESERGGLARLAEHAPVILDEADHGPEALVRALDLGYGGVSMKNCKGVLRALCARGLCAARGAVQSAEDLTNLGVLALHQDLATVAALGIGHVERNGHHYFPGLEHLPAGEAASALAEHPDLWTDQGRGPELRIEDGRLHLSSLQRPGYGYACDIAWAERTPLEAWTTAR